MKDEHTKQTMAPEKLMKKEENRKCADCRGKNPQWASINIGVFICIKCASYHRELGSHISKVKSTSLDKWLHLTLELFKKVNNKIVNNYWEERLYDFKIETIQENEEALRQFIINKYSKKKFINLKIKDPMTRVSDGEEIENERVAKSAASCLVPEKSLSKLKLIKISDNSILNNNSKEQTKSAEVTMNDFTFAESNCDTGADSPTNEEFLTVNENEDEKFQDNNVTDLKNKIEKLALITSTINQIYSQPKVNCNTSQNTSPFFIPNTMPMQMNNMNMNNMNRNNMNMNFNAFNNNPSSIKINSMPPMTITNPYFGNTNVNPNNNYNRYDGYMSYHDLCNKN